MELPKHFSGYCPLITSYKPWKLHFTSKKTLLALRNHEFSMLYVILLKTFNELLLFLFLIFKLKKFDLFNFRAITKRKSASTWLRITLLKDFKRFSCKNVTFNFHRALQRQSSRCAWRIFNAMTLITTPSRLTIWLLGVSMQLLPIAYLGADFSCVSLSQNQSYNTTNPLVTRMDTPKYGDTLEFVYIKYQPILVVLPKVYQV